MKLNPTTIGFPVYNHNTGGILIENREIFYLSKEEVNEYTKFVIKETFKTVIENIEVNNKIKFSDDSNLVMDEQLIINTFQQIFKKFQV